MGTDKMIKAWNRLFNAPWNENSSHVNTDNSGTPGTAKAKTSRRRWSSFEVLTILTTLGVMAGASLPKMFGATQSALHDTTMQALSKVRTGIQDYYHTTQAAGHPAYPTITQLTAKGTVIKGDLPANPFNGSRLVRSASWSGHATPQTFGDRGWCYDEHTGRFWANSHNAGENNW